jgi:DNA-binding transcriptional LysR family regulator
MTAVDPRLLPTFVALAEELHFGRAAERMHVSQPALTQQLQRLERQLGLELFARSRHRVELSAAGAALLPAARAAENAAGAFEEVARELAEGRRGVLRLGVSTGAHYAVQALLSELGELDVQRRTEPSAALAGHVFARDIDAGIGFCVEPVAGVAREPLAEIRASVAVRSSHPLAGAVELSLEDLRGERIALADDRDAPGYNAAVLAALPFAPRTSDRAGGAMAWEQAIDDGCAGLSSASDIHARSASVRLVPLREEVRFPLFLLTAEGDERPVLRTLREAARRLL